MSISFVYIVDYIVNQLTFEKAYSILWLSSFKRHGEVFFALPVTGRLTRREVLAGKSAVRVIPETIPRVEQKILCAAFLEAVIRFYDVPKNQAAFEQWRTEKGVSANGSENRK